MRRKHVYWLGILAAWSLEGSCGQPGAPSQEARDAGPQTGDGSVLTCQEQCDCPAGTVCSIEGVCVGRPCTQPCQGPEDCPCGRRCVDGFCEPFVGDLKPCHANCDCEDWQYCAGGVCVETCAEGGGFRCQGDWDCEECGRVCEPFSHQCVASGTCWGLSDTSCLIEGLPRTLCVPTSNDPFEDRGECQTPAGTPFGMDQAREVHQEPIDPNIPNSPLGAWEFRVSGIGTVHHLTIIVDIEGIHPMVDEVMIEAVLTAPDGTKTEWTLGWNTRAGGVVRCSDTTDSFPLDSLVGIAADGTWTLALEDRSGPVPSTESWVEDWVIFFE